MNVSMLIVKLQEFDPRMQVVFCHDGTYAFPVNEQSLTVRAMRQDMFSDEDGQLHDTGTYVDAGEDADGSTSQMVVIG